MIRYAILTVSDRSAAGQRPDGSGPMVRDAMERFLPGECIATGIVPDDEPDIEAWITHQCDAPDAPDLLITTGGTGLAPRDVTPEVTARLLDRPYSGIMELIRHRCLQHTPLTFLSRGIAGTRKRTLVINLPGSPRAVEQSIEAMADVLPHALATLRGDDVDSFHARMKDTP